MIFKLNLSMLAVNALTALTLAAFAYSPIHLAGSFVVPHTELTISYGVDPSAVSKLAINASQFKVGL